MYFITKPQTIKIPEKFVERDYVLPRIASVQNPLRVAVFISGSGSGLNAMLEYQKTPRAYLISLILSDNEDALGLNYGSKYGVKATAIPLPHTQDKIHQRLSHEAMIDEELVNSNIELIVLNGNMRIITPLFINKWKGRIINIHPSLLPKFPGIYAHRDAINAKTNESGCTVHLVDDGIDTGHILAQKKVSVSPNETIKTLQEKIKKIEHQLYPEIINLLSTGQYHSKS